MGAGASSSGEGTGAGYHEKAVRHGCGIAVTGPVLPILSDLSGRKTSMSDALWEQYCSIL